MSAPPVKIAVAGLVIGAMLLMLLGIAHVARQKQIITIGYQLSKATEELSRNQEANRRLRMEKSALTSPERIQALAKGLGMKQPGPEQIRVVRAKDQLAAQHAASPDSRMSPESDASRAAHVQARAARAQQSGSR